MFKSRDCCQQITGGPGLVFDRGWITLQKLTWSGPRLQNACAQGEDAGAPCAFAGEEDEEVQGKNGEGEERRSRLNQTRISGRERDRERLGFALPNFSL